MELVLQRADGPVENAAVNVGFVALGGAHRGWLFRVDVGGGQAVIGFPKYTTIGVGFEQEPESGNTNLPYTTPAKALLNHSWCNRGGMTATPEEALRAFELVQEAAQEALGKPVKTEDEYKREYLDHDDLHLFATLDFPPLDEPYGCFEHEECDGEPCSHVEVAP